jgi:levansucrase
MTMPAAASCGRGPVAPAMSERIYMSIRDRTAATRVALLAALLVVALGVSAVPGRAATYAPGDDFTAVWSRAQALKVMSDPTNTKPRIPDTFPIMSDKVWVWDTWPLTNLNTRPITYNGWNVIFSLTAPRTVPFGDRHWYARIGFFYARDGMSWKYGGDVFPAGRSFGSREWAGSAVLSGDQVNMFYTASGVDHPTHVDPSDGLQRLATASGRIHADADGVWFSGFRNHKIILEPDGKLYQTLDQSKAGPIIYAFRDPFAFRDPADGQVYLLFEGNTGGQAGEQVCGARELGPVPPGHVVPPESRFYTGNIGLARATTASLRSWKLLPPLLSANCVNQQTERPHLVIDHDQYYLFTISHKFTFAPGLTGPDGLYGFIGDSLRSDYKPLNASALVLGNPAEAPVQQYSEYTMPNWLVESFIDTVPPAIFGGTLAPTLRLAPEGSNTYFVEQLGYGYIPAMAGS